MGRGCVQSFGLIVENGGLGASVASCGIELALEPRKAEQSRMFLGTGTLLPYPRGSFPLRGHKCASPSPLPQKGPLEFYTVSVELKGESFDPKEVALILSAIHSSGRNKY